MTSTVLPTTTLFGTLDITGAKARLSVDIARYLALTGPSEALETLQG